MRQAASFCTFLLGLLLVFSAPPPVQAKCVLGKVAELPVTMAGLKPLATFGINGKNVQLMIDSGAFYSILATSKAKELKLPLEYLPLNLQGIGGYADASYTTVQKFTIAGVDLNKVDFIVASTFGLDGVLGQNFLGPFDVEYDLPHGFVRLFKPHDCGDVRLDYWSTDKLSGLIKIDRMEDRNRHTTGTAEINGQRISVIFDTGASTSVIRRGAAERAGIRINDPHTVYIGQIGGVGGASVDTWIAPIQNFKLGDEEIRNTKISVASVQSDTDMLLGADFFISHRVLVSNSQRKLYFTYEGGPIFNASVTTKEKDADGKGEHDVKVAESIEAEPTDADGFSRRGAAEMGRKAYDKALADLDKAVALAPQEAKYLQERAAAHLALKQSFLAMADLDQAVKLKGNDGAILVSRALLKISGHDYEGAVSDLQTAAIAVSAQSNLRLTIGKLFSAARRPDLAPAELDLWQANHPDDANLEAMFSERCWARGLTATDLDKALKDCDRAIALAPKLAVPRSNRGLIHLRRKEYDLALADYNAALAINPTLPWALYGRGLVLKATGKDDLAKADLDKAVATRDRLKEEAALYHLTP